MKLRNKILMSIMTIAASITLFGSVAMAESFSFDPATVEVKAGETFTVNVATNDNAGFCAMGMQVTGTNDYVTLTAVEDLELYTGAALSTNYNKAFVGFSWYFSEDFSTETTAAGNFIKLTYTVNENLAAGTYDAITVKNNENVSMNMNEDVVDFGTATLKITVVADAPAVETEDRTYAATVTNATSEDKGVTFTVVTDDEAVTGEKSKTVDVPFSPVIEAGDAVVTLLIKAVPKTVGLTVTGEVY